MYIDAGHPSLPPTRLPDVDSHHADCFEVTNARPLETDKKIPMARELIERGSTRKAGGRGVKYPAGENLKPPFNHKTLGLWNHPPSGGGPKKGAYSRKRGGTTLGPTLREAPIKGGGDQKKPVKAPIQKPKAGKKSRNPGKNREEPLLGDPRGGEKFPLEGGGGGAPPPKYRGRERDAPRKKQKQESPPNREGPRLPTRNV